MLDVMTFSDFDASAVKALKLCCLCKFHAASLEFTVRSDDGISKPLHGYCCSGCAGNLLIALEQTHQARNERTRAEASPDSDSTGAIDPQATSEWR